MNKQTNKQSNEQINCHTPVVDLALMTTINAKSTTEVWQFICLFDCWFVCSLIYRIY